MKLYAAAAVLACLAPGIAGAQSTSILTQNVAFGPGPTDFSRSLGMTTNAGALPFFFFDTRVGTLNSVTFSSNYQFLSTIFVSNASSSPSSGSAYTKSAAQFSADDAGVSAALNRVVNNLVDPIDGTSVTFGGSTLSPIAYDVRGTATAYSLLPGGTAALTSNGSGSMAAFVDTSATTLAAFSRNGTFSYNPLLTTLTGLVLANSGGNTTASQTTIASAFLTITYNVTPFATSPSGPGGGVTAAVPEPGMWVSLLLGIGMIGATGRRRRKAAPRLA